MTITSTAELDQFLTRRLDGLQLRMPLLAHPPALRIGLSARLVAMAHEPTTVELGVIAKLAADIYLRCFDEGDRAWVVAHHDARARVHIPEDARRADGSVDLQAPGSRVEIEGMEVSSEQSALLARLLGLQSLPEGCASTGSNLYGTVSEQLPHLSVPFPTEDLIYVEVRLPIAPHRIQYKELFGHIIRQDFPDTGPSLRWDVYLVNLTRGLVMNVYDDRGLDLLADGPDVLRALRDEYAGLVLEAPGLDDAP